MGLEEALDARLEADDHDLLTYNEVEIRLLEEIALKEKELVSSPERAEVIQARIAALRDAIERNGQTPANLQLFENFWGYKPDPV